MWHSSSVMARPRPSAVLFIATEMLAESSAAFSDGLTAATAASIGRAEGTFTSGSCWLFCSGAGSAAIS